jgi:hypothetical protein
VSNVTASAESLMEQAGWTADEYLAAAIKHIDERLGEGYAKKNPALVGQFMITAAMDYQAADMRQGIDGIAQAIRNARSMAERHTGGILRGAPRW